MHTARTLHQFEAGHHGAEVVPARNGNLYHVDDEEHHVADSEPEVEKARELIAADERGEPVELRWFVDGQAGEDRARAREKDKRIGDLLGRVVLALRGLLPAQMQIVQEDMPRVAECMTAGTRSRHAPEMKV
jgi:hypothetical protein